VNRPRFFAPACRPEVTTSEVRDARADRPHRGPATMLGCLNPADQLASREETTRSSWGTAELAAQSSILSADLAAMRVVR